jgi:hypothetical protein
LEPAFQSTLPVTAAAAWLYGCTYTEMIRLELETGNLRRRAKMWNRQSHAGGRTCRAAISSRVIFR